MKEKYLTFEEYPLQIPTEKRTINKCEFILNELEQCGSLLTAKLPIKHWNKLSDELETDIAIITCRYTLDTRNKTYKNAQNKVDELLPILQNYSTKYQRLIVKSRFKKEFEQVYGKYLVKKYEANLKTFDPKIIPDLIEENKLTTKYDEIMGGAKIKFRGGVYNLSQMGKFMSDVDRETRKEASVAVDKWLGDHDAELGELYDKLVHLRDAMAKKLGFKNFVELGYLRLGRTDYNAKMVKGYRQQIKDEVVPVAQKLLKEQIESLEIKDPQSFDFALHFKDGNPKPVGDAKVLVSRAKAMYEDMSFESGGFINFMIDNHLLDLEAREGKAPGGYCTYFPEYKAPFIFSNFNGTEWDVNVLCHEGGHAFQAYLSSDIRVPEYRNPTLESCEIHSMSMEFFTWPYMEKFFGKDADKYRFSHLADAIEFLPYGITIDEFQHWVYEHPNATHDQRCAKYLEIEKANLPHKKYDYCPTLAKGRWWLRQGHVFGSPFYYIDYTLAQVVAFQFLAEDLKNHEKAWKKYVKLCKLGGKFPFTELLEKADLRNPFEPGTVKKNIAPLLKVLKKF